MTTGEFIAEEGIQFRSQEVEDAYHNWLKRQLFEFGPLYWLDTDYAVEDWSE